MFISSIRTSAIQLLVPAMLLALFSGSFLKANDELDQALHRLSVLHSAEINLVQAQLDLERWKHAQLEELHKNGFASWLELRRHQFKVDSIVARLKSFRDFELFLLETETKKQSVGENRSLVFRKRDSRPIKVFSPGSVRLIGWIEGQTSGEPRKIESNATVIKAAQEKLAKAEKRDDLMKNSDSSSAEWREKVTLELAVAKRELEHLRAFENLQMPSHHDSTLAVLIDEIENFVTSDQNDALKLATITVKQAEAATSGHIKSAQIMLVREQRRADAVRRLHSQGHASAKELAIVNERLAEIKSQLDGFTRNREALKNSIRTTKNQNELVAASYESVNQWPVIVFNDQEFVLHLVELRQEFFNEIAISETARLKAEFLQQVLDRLKVAPKKSNPESQIGLVLNEGQRNEIESYEIDIQFANASLAATLERQQILVHEESRFLQQIIALNDAARHEIATSEKPSIEALSLLGRIRPTAVMASNGNPKPLTRFSYLELDDLGAVGRSSNLSLAQSNLRFVGSPYSFRSLDLFNLRPVRSSLLLSDSRRANAGWEDLRVEPHWMKYFHRNLRQNSYTVLRMSSPPYADAWPQKVFYGQYGYRAFGGTYGYPNGILRADWRSNTTPGQVPWYAPGSPANIRANQLYYRRDGKPYQRW